MIRATNLNLPASVLLVCLSIGSSAQLSTAALILTQSAPTPLNGGLVGITISAQGTAGEIINTITGLDISTGFGGLGVHNVAQAFTGGSTQSTQQHTPGLWNDAWTPYDTHFMYNTAQTLSAGSDFTDTQNGATTGTLGLPSVPDAPQSGFGAYTSSLSSAKVILSPNADSDVPFLYVVVHVSNPFLLDVRVDGQLLGGGGIFQVFTDYTSSIPEPATIGLVCMAAVGCFGFFRRR